MAAGNIVSRHYDSLVGGLWLAACCALLLHVRRGRVVWDQHTCARLLACLPARLPDAAGWLPPACLPCHPALYVCVPTLLPPTLPQICSHAGGQRRWAAVHWRRRQLLHLCRAAAAGAAGAASRGAGGRGCAHSWGRGGTGWGLAGRPAVPGLRCLWSLTERRPAPPTCASQASRPRRRPQRATLRRLTSPPRERWQPTGLTCSFWPRGWAAGALWAPATRWDPASPLTARQRWGRAVRVEGSGWRLAGPFAARAHPAHRRPCLHPSLSRCLHRCAGGRGARFCAPQGGDP